MLSECKTKIVFLTPSSSQPRFHRRVGLLCDATSSIFVFYFIRKYYNINTFPAEIEQKSLGNLEDGKYLLRIPKLLRAFFIIYFSKPFRASHFIYCFSFDLALISFFSFNKKLILEIGDLRTNGFLGRIIEYIFFKRSYKIILTSQGFRDYYIQAYPKFSEKFFVLENIPDFTKDKTQETEKAFFTIGTIGLLRYEKPLRLLRRFIEENNYLLSIFGDGPCKDIFLVHPHKNIKFFGEFKNPDDLSMIYSNIDLSFSVYDNTNQNVRLATPNKLYESIFYNVPLLVADNTFVGDIVTKYNIGSTIRLDSYDVFSQDMASAISKIDIFKSSISKININNFNDDTQMFLKCIFEE